MNVNVLDFETFWSSKDYTLSKMGPVEYIRDSRFDAQMLGFSCNGLQAAVYDADIPTLIARLDPADVYVGHNIGGFDALILSERYGFRPRHIWDTIWMARWCGLSRIGAESHAALTELLGNGVKKAGTVVSDGKQYPQEFTPEEVAFFRQYCADDVNQCQANMAAMLPYMTDDALRFMSLTARMATEPVFVLDEAMLEEYIRQLDAEAEDARQKVMSLFHFANLQEFFKAIRSADQFADMLRALGVEPPMKVSEKKTATAIAKVEAQLGALDRGDVASSAGGTASGSVLVQGEAGVRSIFESQLVDLRTNGVRTYAFSKSDLEFLELQEHEDPRVRLLVETRLEFNSSILRSRAETLLKFARQHRPLPIMLSAFKAHTSRYSAGVSEGKSDGVQVQNLSKRNPAHLILRKAIQAPKGYKVVAADSSQVELRVNAWMAQQEDLLAQLREGRDPYAELAVRFDNRYTAKDIHDGAKSGDKDCKKLRNVAKQLLLACGYGTSPQKFAMTLLRQGMHLSPDRAEHNAIAEQYHTIYRNTNAAIVYFWKRCGQVLRSLIAGYSGSFGGPNDDTFEYGMMRLGPLEREVASIKLPSGYILRYPNLRLNEAGEIVYDFKLGKNIVPRRIYGSALDENCCQSLAFQTLMYQACRMDEAGIQLKCNIHDSWATVVPESDAEATAQMMVHYMRQVPPWLAGCPLDAESEIGENFKVV